MLQRLTNWRADRQVRTPEQEARMRDRVSKKTDLVEIFSWVSISHGLSCGVVQLHALHVSCCYSRSCSTSFPVLTCECPPVCECPLLACSDSFTYSHPGSCHPSLPALFPPQTLSFHVLTCPSVFAKVSAPCLDPFHILISIGLHQARSKHVCGVHCTSCECPSLTWILSAS